MCVSQDASQFVVRGLWASFESGSAIGQACQPCHSFCCLVSHLGLDVCVMGVIVVGTYWVGVQI